MRWPTTSLAAGDANSIGPRSKGTIYVANTEGLLRMSDAGTRISHLDGDIIGLYVQVNVLQVRENTEDDYSHEGEYGRIAEQGLQFIPVYVDLEDGTQELFWRHSLVVVDSFICASCQGVFRGVDYLCDECRITNSRDLRTESASAQASDDPPSR